MAESVRDSSSHLRKEKQFLSFFLSFFLSLQDLASVSRAVLPLCYTLCSPTTAAGGGIIITSGGGGGGPGELWLLLAAAAVEEEEEEEELDAVLYLCLLRRGTFAKIMRAMRRRRVAIMPAAMMPPWTIVGFGRVV